MTLTFLGLVALSTNVEVHGPLRTFGDPPTAVRRWNRPTVSFRLEADTPRPLSRAQFVNVTRDAVDVWNRHAQRLGMRVPRLALQIEPLPPTVEDATAFERENDRLGPNAIYVLEREPVAAISLAATRHRPGPGIFTRFVIGLAPTSWEKLSNGGYRELPWTADMLRHALLHEFGHALGLDHVELPRAFAAGDGLYTPVMFHSLWRPFKTSLAPDDEASMAFLYAQENVVPQGYAQIRGRVTKDSQPVRGVNVIAEPAFPDSYEIRGQSFSGVTGAWVSQDPGAFRILVTPGQSYRVFVNELQVAGPSGTGPRARRGQVDRDPRVAALNYVVVATTPVLAVGQTLPLTIDVR